MLLIDGALATALRERNAVPALRARVIAAAVLAQSGPVEALGRAPECATVRDHQASGAC